MSLSFKISYQTLDGYESKAYVDEEPQGDYHYGVNKHTDEAVVVYWTGTDWIEVDPEKA